MAYKLGYEGVGCVPVTTAGEPSLAPFPISSLSSRARAPFYERQPPWRPGAARIATWHAAWAVGRVCFWLDSCGKESGRRHPLESAEPCDSTPRLHLISSLKYRLYALQHVFTQQSLSAGGNVLPNDYGTGLHLMHRPHMAERG